MIPVNLAGFFNEYYVRPIVEGSGYNVVNTVTYAALLILFVYLVLRTLDRRDVELDRELWIDLIPFIFLGGLLRALEDTGFFLSLGSWNYVFITPLIYFLVFSLAFIPLLLIHYLDLNRRYLRYFGLALLGVFSAPVALNVVRGPEFLLVLAMASISCGLTWLFLRKAGLKMFEKAVNWSPVFAHSLDASATVVAVSVVGTYTEQHVVPSLLFGSFPVFLFIPIKLALASAVVYYIDRELSGKWRWMLRFMILVLGLGPGTRNALTILMGT